VPRNLTDEQIKIIAEEFDGTIGIVEYSGFVMPVGAADHSCPGTCGQLPLQEYYLKHINYLRELLGSVDNICVATDDMLLNYKEGDKPPIYKHEEVAERIINLLQNNGYNEEEIERILHKNFEKKILARPE